MIIFIKALPESYGLFRLWTDVKNNQSDSDTSSNIKNNPKNSWLIIVASSAISNRLNTDILMKTYFCFAV